MNYKEISLLISDKIKDSYNIVITSHVGPDGDAIGSMLGLYHFIKKEFRKKPSMFITGGINHNLLFLDGAEEIKRYDDKVMEDIISADLIFVLDLNDLSRLKEAGDAVAMSNAYKVMIDHHMEPKKFADLEMLNTNATSTGELIWRLINSIEGKITSKIANSLYTAIMTDTGSFRFDRTDSETHKIIANLIESGANPTMCFDEIYNQKTIQGLKLLGTALTQMDLYSKGKISIMSLKNIDFARADAIEDNTEGFVHNTLSIKGVEVGAMITEREQNEVRISLRSKGNISVREVAQKFGGGGHQFAAGARVLNEDFDIVKTRVVDELEKLF
jgi:phosphoesterase RecJ-like protein